MLDKNRRFFKLGENWGNRGVAYFIDGFRFLSFFFDFYQFFFSSGKKIKNIFLESVYLRETGSEVTIQTIDKFTEYSMALRRASLAGVPGHYPGQLTMLPNATLSVPDYALAGATLSVRQLRCGAGSGVLRPPCVPCVMYIFLLLLSFPSERGE